MAARLAGWVRRIAFGLALLGAGVGPLAPTVEATVTLRLLVHMFFLLAVALWLVAMALDGRFSIHRTGMGAACLLFAGAVVASVVNASYRYPAALTAFFWLTNMLAFIYLVHEARARRARAWMLAVICASAFVVALHGIHQHEVELREALERLTRDPTGVLQALHLPPQMAFDLEGRIRSQRVFSTFVVPNSLAGYLALVFPAFLGLWLDRLRRREPGEGRFLAVVGVVLLGPVLVALFFTKSKGGALAFLAGTAALGLWAFRHVLWRRRLQVFGAGLLLLVMMGVAQVSGLLPPPRDYLGSLAVRRGYWRAGLTLFERHPVSGIGLDNFADAYAAVKLPSEQEARRAHNDYIQVAAEMGLTGLVLYAALWVAFWRRVWRRKAEPVLPPAEAAVSPAAAIAGVAALGTLIFTIEAFAGGTLHTAEGGPGRAWPMMLAVAWVGVVVLHVRSAGRTLRRDSYATIGMASGLVAFLVHGLLDFDLYVPATFQTVWLFMGLTLAAHLNEEQDRFVVDRPLHAFGRFGLILVASAGVYLALYGFVRPVADAQMYRERARDLLGEATRIERPAALRRLMQAQRALERAIASCPWDAENPALLSDVLFVRAQAEDALGPSGQTALSDAIRRVRQAIRLDPRRSEYYTRLGRLHEWRWRVPPRNAADFQAAEAAYTRAEELFPSNPDTALNLGRLYDLAGRYPEALGKYHRALDISERHYHIPRKYRGRALEQLRARVEELMVSITASTAPPPLRFTDERLLNALPPPAVPGG